MSDQSLFFTQRGMRPINKLICLSLVSAVLLMLDNRFSAVRQAKRYAATAIYPLQWLANQPVEWYEYGSALFQSQNYLLGENQRLTAENSRLRMEAQQSQVQKRELSELKSLLLLQQNGLENGITAEVISNGKDPSTHRIIIDKGSRQNIRAGDAVVADGGLVGQVSQSHPISSEVSLIIHANTVIPVMVARTGVRSLIHGDSGGITLRYFPTEADLQPNDILVTSGIDSVYPAGIPVAKVMQTGRNAGTPYYRAQLQPLAALDSSKYVLVLPQTGNPETVQAASAAAASAVSPSKP